MMTEERLARLRAKVPMLLLPALMAARTRSAWAREEVREDARAQMRFLLEHTRPDADLDAVSRAYVAYQVRRGELRWHPEEITRLRVEGLHHLCEAKALGRGVIVNFVHHGIYEGGLASIAQLGFPSYMVVYPYMLEPDAPLWLQQHVRVATSTGGSAVSAAVGTDGLTDLLRRGEAVAIATDVPGRTPLRFAGREVLGSFGAARLATATNAPVVAFTTEEDGEGPFIRVHPPLHPGDAADAEELLGRMLAIHEAAVLRQPEATDLPLSRWGTVEARADHG